MYNFEHCPEALRVEVPSNDKLPILKVFIYATS